MSKVSFWSYAWRAVLIKMIWYNIWIRDPRFGTSDLITDFDLYFLEFVQSDSLISDLNETTDIIDDLVGGFMSVLKPKDFSDLFNIEFDPFKKSDIRGYEVSFQIGSRKVALLHTF